MVKEENQPRIGADFALFIPFIIEECCLASFKLTFASIEVNLQVAKADSGPEMQVALHICTFWCKYSKRW